MRGGLYIGRALATGHRRRRQVIASSGHASLEFMGQESGSGSAAEGIENHPTKD
jgi:hypothetical protein